jgi:uncharacterized membrane protein
MNAVPEVQTSVQIGEFEQRLDGLRFRIAFSFRYHQRREAFFDSWDKFAKAVAVVGGAASVSTLLGESADVKLWIAAIITVTSTASLVVGFSQKARLHFDLRKRYAQVESELVGVKPSSLDALPSFESKILLIEGDEPPTLSCLVQICQNEIVIARGQRNIYPLPRWKHVLANYFDMGATAVPPEKERNAA